MPDCIGCRIGCRIELDDTILHKHNPVGNRHRKVHLMNDDNHRHPFLRKLANHVEHVPAQALDPAPTLARQTE
jgi:hypothetical protein